MAQLAPVVDSLDTIPEPARQFYRADNGKFVVDLSGLPPGAVSAADLAAANAKIVEFRTTNVGLLQEVEPLRALKVKVGDIDIDAAKTALTTVTELGKKRIAKVDDLATAIKTAVDAAVQPLTTQLTTITTHAAETQKRADGLTLRSQLNDVFGKAGGVPDALDFIVSRASGVFKVVDGVVVPEDNQFSADKPGEKLSITEWMTQQTKASSFAFKPSNGSGANPNNEGGGGRQFDPNVKVIKDPTPQEIGKWSADVKAGKARFEFSADAVKS